MAYEGEVTAVNLTKERNSKAMEIVNIIAEEEDRAGLNVAERLIIQAGKVQALKIKKQKQQRKGV